MHSEVTIAGFGGQGIMVAGKLLALAGLEEGREVVWLPSYGPEMRGGTAYCNVVISDRPIGSPVFAAPSTALVMNLPSLDKFGPCVKKNGMLIINSSLIETSSNRDDIRICHVPCNDIALEVGNGKAANMVALGAYVGCT
ncbi:MAG: 2-oxoacid:ferredoxin oxidoreductase subunit gamma, partial [Deltaproteobacteria bacterium RIFOXYB12_FULL_58_9]